MKGISTIRNLPLVDAAIGTLTGLVLHTCLKRWTSLRSIVIDLLSFTAATLCAALLSAPKQDRKAQWAGLCFGLVAAGYLLLGLKHFFEK